MRALITGATGFIGRRLLPHVEHATVLTRDASRVEAISGKVTSFAWDLNSSPPPQAAFDGVDAVFHLSGESVGEGRWTEKKKARIRDSRIVGTRNLVAGLRALQKRPAVLISASAIGYYGDRGDEILDETSTQGSDFLAEVCIGWERESHAARDLGVRVVNPRTGIVLGSDGGALPKMLLPFKLGVGGRLGSGRQWMSWIHMADVVGLMLLAASNPALDGPLNLTAPNPVTNSDFTAALAKTLHRPAVFPAPKFALKLAVGEFAEVLLGSQRVLPRAAERAGYSFQYPTLDAALTAAISPTKS